MSVSRRRRFRVSLFGLLEQSADHIFKTIPGLFALVQLHPRIFSHADVLVGIASHIRCEHGHRHKQLPTIGPVDYVNHVYHEYMGNLYVHACER